MEAPLWEWRISHSLRSNSDPLFVLSPSASPPFLTLLSVELFSHSDPPANAV